MKPLQVRNSETTARLAWRIKAQGNVAEVELYDQIGVDWWDGSGISAADFVRDLRAIKASTINLRINSPGGIVDDAKAIYNALQQHSATVNAFIEGVAASAASFIAMAADHISIAPHARIQIHDAQAFVGIVEVTNAAGIDGLLTDLRNMRNILDEESDDIASIYAERAGGDAGTWRRRMQANGEMGTSFRGQEAVDLGLADEVGGKSVDEIRPHRNGEDRRIAALANDEHIEEPDEPVMADEPVDQELFKQITARGYEPPMPTDITRLIERNLKETPAHAS